jgi:hypothetical protein
MEICAELSQLGLNNFAAPEDIASLIELQSDVEENGMLVVGGRANLFFVRGLDGETFAVSVSGHAVILGIQWKLGAWRYRTAEAWPSGCAVFCPVLFE